MEKYREIEKSLIKKFRKEIWSKFVKAIKEYDLIKEFDKIAVCISGGKDSFVLAKLFQELQRHGQIKFDLVFIVMNPGYEIENLEKIKNNATLLNIPIEIFDTEVFKISTTLNEKSPCYLCARMRRGYLYNKAKEMGCNKIALGHHLDDVIETTLLSVLYGGEFKTMIPKLKSQNYENMELIRPLYLVNEIDIKKFVNYNNLEFMDCSCAFAKKGVDSKRKLIKELIANLEKDNKYVRYSIFKSAQNINLDALLYKK